VLTAVGALCPAAAEAAFPGQDGRIAFHRPPAGMVVGQELWLIDPTGSAETTFFNPAPGFGAGSAAWSPDGARLAFVVTSAGSRSIHISTASGAGDTAVTTLEANGVGLPSWSPDGSKIVFIDDQGNNGTRELYVVNADGTGRTLVAGNANLGVSWSPDGSKIAFGASDGNIHVIASDGTGDTPITSSGYDSVPDWSPDGSRIAFSSEREAPCFGLPCDREIFVVNSDGTGEINITDTPVKVLDTNPSWSPSGAEIAFQRWPVDVSGTNVYRMNADGTGLQQVTTSLGFDPAWQPLITGGYPRPKGATPLRASLVPAYTACTAPNRMHGPPLGFPSCSPPAQRSAVLTVGTPDANGNPANSVGSARYDVVPGNPATPLDEADVEITVDVTDVRCQAASAACPGGAGSDYAGRLLLIAPPLRITDKDNQPATNGQGAATGDTNFPVPFDCEPTASTTIGSSCALTTTADAMVPGAIKEGRRSIWEFGQVHVRDAGPNGTGYGAGCPPACGDGDETLFLREGIFVP
jgi:TolB protein